MLVDTIDYGIESGRSGNGAADESNASNGSVNETDNDAPSEHMPVGGDECEEEVGVFENEGAFS